MATLDTARLQRAHSRNAAASQLHSVLAVPHSLELQPPLLGGALSLAPAALLLLLRLAQLRALLRDHLACLRTEHAPWLPGRGGAKAGMQAALHRRRTAAASCSESPPGPARLDMMSRVAAPPACWWRESTLLLVLHGHRHEPLRWPEPSTHGRATRASRRAGQPVRCAVRRGDRCAGAASSRGAARIRGRGWPQHNAAAARPT